MDADYQICIKENFETVFSGTFSGSLELGRQKHGEDAPYSLNRHDSGTGSRLVIAEHTETTVGRKQVLLAPQSGEQIKLTNCSLHAAIAIDGAEVLDPESSRVVSMPVTFLCGHKRIVVNLVEDDESGLNSLSSPIFSPDDRDPYSERFVADDDDDDSSAGQTMIPMDMVEKGQFRTAHPLARTSQSYVATLQDCFGFLPVRRGSDRQRRGLGHGACDHVPT